MEQNNKKWTIAAMIVVFALGIFIGYAIGFKLWNQKMGNEIDGPAKGPFDAVQDIGTVLEQNTLNPLEGVQLNPFE